MQSSISVDTWLLRRISEWCLFVCWYSDVRPCGRCINLSTLYSSSPKYNDLRWGNWELRSTNNSWSSSICLQNMCHCSFWPYSPRQCLLYQVQFVVSIGHSIQEQYGPLIASSTSSAYICIIALHRIITSDIAADWTFVAKEAWWRRWWVDPFQRKEILILSTLHQIAVPLRKAKTL